MEQRYIKYQTFTFTFLMMVVIFLLNRAVVSSVIVIMQHVLGREDNWNSWKNDSCPNFIRTNDEARPKTTARYVCYR